MKDKNRWAKYNGKLELRSGTRAGWIEMVFTKKDGRQVKVVGKVVGKFYSEGVGTAGQNQAQEVL